MLELSVEYIAGLFDGEGHVSITWSRGNPKLCVKLTNTYLPVLEAVKDVYGGTFYANKKQKAHYLQCYALSLTVEQSKRFLRELLPFLVIKKRQAELALLFSETVYKHGKFAGHLLWSECMKNNPEAWAEMKLYNTNDVLSLEELYDILSSWDNTLPNFDVYVDEILDMSVWEEDGFHYSNLGKYKRYRNKITGVQRRSRVNLLPKEKRDSLLSNITS